mgnify:CR=1 FL=1
MKASRTDAATWPAAQTRHYRLIQTDRLTPYPPVWSDSGHGVIQPEGASELTKGVLNPASTQRFYRVQAIIPLSP